MPYKVVKRTGAKPWKIVRMEPSPGGRSGHETVGSSTSKKKAEASVRARLGGEHGMKKRKR